MADYYPLLMRAISALPDNNPAARAAIFARAREALDRQLRSIDPPLSETQLEEEKIGLEAVFTRIDQEFAPEPAPDLTDDVLFAPIEPAILAPRLPTSKPLPEVSQPDEPEDERPTIIPSRPQAKMGEASKAASNGQRKRILIGLSIALMAMAGMATLALTNKESSEIYKAARKIERPEPAADLGKTENRLASSETPEPTPTTRPASPVQAPVQSDTTTSPLPVSQRAFMVQEARTSGSAPPQFEGRVLWSYSGGANGTLRAGVEFSGANLNLDLSMARNTDEALKASHTILITFDPKDGTEGVREISAIEWRERESQQGATLIGLVVPVQENTFMIGLDKTDFAMNRNVELLRTQKWMVFELRFSNGRRAAILIEKGSGGDKAVQDALAAWK